MNRMGTGIAIGVAIGAVQHTTWLNGSQLAPRSALFWLC